MSKSNEIEQQLQDLLELNKSMLVHVEFIYSQVVFFLKDFEGIRQGDHCILQIGSNNSASQITGNSDHASLSNTVKSSSK